MVKLKTIWREIAGILRQFKRTVLDKTILFIIIIVAISIILYWPIWHINYPITNDEGGYSFMASKILHGAVPYKDYFDHKPPAIYYTFALAFLLFGKSLYTIRFLIFVVNICVAITIYFIGRALKKSSVGQVASILFLFAALTPLYYGMYALTEPFLMLFSMLCLLFYIKSDEGKNWKMVILSGISLGLATAFKQSAFPIMIAFLIYFILGFWKKDNRNLNFFKQRTYTGLFLGAGVGIVWLIIIAFFTATGALHDMIYCVFTYNEDYLSWSKFADATRDYIWAQFIHYEYVFILGIIWMVATVFMYVFKKKYDYDMLIFLTFITLIIPLRYYQFIQYFLPVFPFLSIMAGEITVSLYKFLIKKPMDHEMITTRHNLIKKKSVTTSFVKDCTFAAKVFILLIVVFMLNNTWVCLRTSYPPSYKNTPSALVTFIDTHTSSDDKIFVYGTPPYYYFTMDRDPPSKYFYLYGICKSETIQKEIVDGIEHYQVQYVLITKNAVTKYGDPIYGEIIYDHIISHYTYNCTIESVDIYERST